MNTEQLIKLLTAYENKLKELGNILHQLGCDNAVRDLKQFLELNKYDTTQHK